MLTCDDIHSDENWLRSKETGVTWLTSLADGREGSRPHALIVVPSSISVHAAARLRHAVGVVGLPRHPVPVRQRLTWRRQHPLAVPGDVVDSEPREEDFVSDNQIIFIEFSCKSCLIHVNFHNNIIFLLFMTKILWATSNYNVRCEQWGDSSPLWELIMFLTKMFSSLELISARWPPNTMHRLWRITAMKTSTTRWRLVKQLKQASACIVIFHTNYCHLNTFFWNYLLTHVVT